MLNKKIEKAFNAQINAEIYSAYLYLSMSAYFESLSLPGAANWMRVQAQEEMVHAMKFYSFINERDGRVTLAAIDAPATKWKSPLAVFESGLAHEVKVTALINGLMSLAEAENDYASRIFLEWFVTEQVEEEANAKTVIDKINLLKDMPGGIFMIDKELGARVFTPPPAAG